MKACKIPFSWCAISDLPQVYLPAIEGHVPDNIIHAIRALIEFCYIARHNIITDATLLELKDALNHFHQYHTIFTDVGVQENRFSLPRQHALSHYESLIRLFGAPNGLCSSITESKHIVVVKKPWWHSNRHKALGQILRTNQWLSQLTAAHANFEVWGMLPVSHQVFTPVSNGKAGLYGKLFTKIFWQGRSAEGGEEGSQAVDEDHYSEITDNRPGLAHSDIKLASTPSEYHKVSYPTM